MVFMMTRFIVDSNFVVYDEVLDLSVPTILIGDRFRVDTPITLWWVLDLSYAVGA